MSVQRHHTPPITPKLTRLLIGLNNIWAIIHKESVQFKKVTAARSKFKVLKEVYMSLTSLTLLGSCPVNS